MASEPRTDSRDANPDHDNPVDALLRAKGIDAVYCPVCRATEWLNMEDTSHKPALLAVNADADLETPVPHHKVYALACGTCGFIRQHSRAFVDSGTFTAKT